MVLAAFAAAAALFFILARILIMLPSAGSLWSGVRAAWGLRKTRTYVALNRHAFSSDGDILVGPCSSTWAALVATSFCTSFPYGAADIMCEKRAAFYMANNGKEPAPFVWRQFGIATPAVVMNVRMVLP
jgi:hypothetical protein